MTSRVVVMRKTGGTTPAAQGYEVPEWGAVHVDLPFRLVPRGSRTLVVGGVEFENATARGDLPWDTTNLADDDFLEIVSGEWAGSVFRVVEAVKGDQRTARRVPVEEVPRPEEWA